MKESEEKRRLSVSGVFATVLSSFLAFLLFYAAVKRAVHPTKRNKGKVALLEKQRKARKKSPRQPLSSSSNSSISIELSVGEME